MDCFVAFGAMLSVPFQTDSMFPYPKENAPLVMLSMLDSSNRAAGGKAAAAGLATVPSGHPLGSWLFPSFPLQSEKMKWSHLGV